MSQELLVQALQNTLSPDVQIRTQAEQYLEQLASQKGFLPVLLQVVSHSELDANVRISAALYFKNVVYKEWPLRSHRPSTIDDGDRDIVRQACVELMFVVDGVAQKSIQESLRIIISNDYPERFPNVVEVFVSALRNAGNDNKKIYGALLGCRVLAKKYEYYYDEKARTNLNQIIVPQLFPILVSMYEQLIDNACMESFVMQNVMSKVFFSVIKTNMPPTLVSDHSLLQRWLSILLRVIDKRLPDEMLPSDPDHRYSHPFWKNHKRVCMIIVKLFMKYAKNGKNACEQKKWFSEVLEKQYAASCLEGMWKLLQLRSQGKYLPDIVCMYCFDFIDALVKFGKSTREMVMPQVDTLMFTIIFPELCFNQDDQDSWDEDPHDYVFHTLDLMSDFTSCRVSARDLLFQLLKKNDSLLFKYVDFCNQQLIVYQSDPSLENARKKDGVLMSLGILESRLSKHDSYAKALPTLIMSHVAPEIESQFPFLRSRACCTLAEFAHYAVDCPDSVIHSLLNRLTDPELPVQVQAALSIRRLLQVCKKAKELVRPMLATLLEQFITLINNIDNDDVIDALKQIVDSYDTEIQPYATGLVNFLSEHFLRLANTDDEGDIGLAAVACLKTLCAVLECVAGQPELYSVFEQPLYRVFEFVFGDSDIFLEDGIDLATTLTYCSPKMTPMMWSVYKKVYTSFMEDTNNCFAKEYLHVFDNMISRDPVTFVTGGDGEQTNIRMMYNMIERVLTHEAFEDLAGEDDKLPMCKLIYSIYHHCTGVDDYVEPFTHILLSQLLSTGADGQPRSDEFVSVIVTVLAAGLYYNATLQLTMIAKHNGLQQFFQHWMACIMTPPYTPPSGQPRIKTKFESKVHKKISVLGLSAVLALGDQLPDIIKGNMNMIMEGVYVLVQALDTQRKTEEDIMAGNDEDEETEEDEGEGESDDEGFGGFGGYDDDEDDDFDQFFNDDEDDDYESPIDNIDEVVFFAQHLQKLGEKSPQYALAMNQALPGELQSKIQMLVASAPERAFKQEQRNNEVKQEAASLAGEGAQQQSPQQ